MLSQEELKAAKARLTTREPMEKMSDEELQALLNTLYDIGMHENLMSSLAAHYNLPYKKLEDLLLARQLIYLHMITDYTKEEGEADVQKKLANQVLNVKAVVERATAAITKLDEALAQTEFIRSEAIRVLALYKARYLKEGNETPKK